MSNLVLSLFPGLDLLGMAFEAEDFCVVAGPDVCWGRDIRSFHPPAGKFDGVIGGPPCQSFSTLANLVRARGYEPRFGNLIPEFVRCVEEAQPNWFLMENVPGVQVEFWPAPEGYQMRSFVLDNSWLDSGDGFGEEQMRKRRWWFGVLGSQGVELRQWIDVAVFELPKAKAVTADPRQVPVAIGGSGKLKRTRREAVTTRSGMPLGPGGIDGRNCGERYSMSEMMILQGLAPTALDEAPFTMEGKRKLVGNGVPIPMGRALAKAVKEAVSSWTDE